MTWTDREADVQATPTPGIPPNWDGPASGDEVFAERHADGSRKVWQRDSSGTLRDIGHAVTDVVPTDDGFRVTGRRYRSGVPIVNGAGNTAPWVADCLGDKESSPDMLRGKVR